jgi:uncharacterized protein (TIGR02594 family)
MADIQWGLLQPQQAIDPVKASSPMAPQSKAPNIPTPSDSSGSGDKGLLGGLSDLISGVKNLFGQNPVSIANNALSSQMSQMSAPDLAAQITGATTPSSMAQKVQGTMAGQGAGPYSVQNVQMLAQQAFPGDPVRQQLAVAQATQESGLLGTPSKLATQGNNLFGMKGQGTQGSLNMPTTENVNGQNQKQMAGFAAYKSPQESMEAYKNLMSQPRYQDVMKASTFEEGANALQKDGYATDPNYASALINVNSKIGQKNSVMGAVQAASQPGATPLDVANGYAGLGRANHPEVLQGFFQKSMGQAVNVQSTPWCAAFANSVLMNTGHGGTGSMMAKSFLNYGTPTQTPTNGDVVVLNRGNDPNLGHVGFFAGYGKDGQTVKILGGNEDGMVKTKEYPVSSVAGYRIPPSAQEIQTKGPANQTNQNSPQQQNNSGDHFWDVAGVQN